MASSSTQFGEADLTTCDCEVIHNPGYIQPHGILIVADRQGLAILQVAGNTQQQLGLDPASLLQQTLHELLDESTLNEIRTRLLPCEGFVAPFAILGVRTRHSDQTFNLAVHANVDSVIIEAESLAQTPTHRGNALSLTKAMLSTIRSLQSLKSCCQAVTREMRAATGFARVMIYRFMDDGSGVVVAEDKADHLESFLGLHYPATDFPQQARALLIHNGLRLIPSVDYQPAPLTPALDPRSGQALDMSDCCLRSVSPIHREFLRNMGVGASMAVSIISRGKLWGLITCHHPSAHYLSADLRIACELFGQIFSLHIESKEGEENADERIAARLVMEALVRRVTLQPHFSAELVGNSGLLDLVAASGAAVMFDGELHTVGIVPPAEFIAQLPAWLNSLNRPVFATSHLAAVYPAATPYVGEASGLLAISLSRQPKDYVLWFRPEIARTVTWAGNPQKTVLSGPLGERLTPRASFAAWQETVRHRAAPWSDHQIEAALALRVTLLETVLTQADQARKEREAASLQQDFLMAELDHRVKNTLANIQALVQQSKIGCNGLDEFVQSLEWRIRAMAHAHGLLAATRWQGASLRGLIEEELGHFRPVAQSNLKIEGDDLLLTPAASMSVSMVIHELTTNAAKYGALSVPTGSVHVSWHVSRHPNQLTFDWCERGGPPVKVPERRGFGSVVIERSIEHELDGSATLRFEPEGLCCTLIIPTEHIIDHGEN